MNCNSVAPYKSATEITAATIGTTGPSGIVNGAGPWRRSARTDEHVPKYTMSLASALHEMADKSDVGILLDEPSVPVSPQVRAAGEVLGIDPLVVANEGKAVIGLAPEAVAAALEVLRAHPLGRQAAVVGRCLAERPGNVILDTGFGRRLLAEVEGEPLPRIC